MKLKIEYVPIDSIKPYSKNAKLHPAEQIEQIKKSIQEFGFKDAIAVWHDECVCGHGRLLAAKELGMKELPIVRLDDLTDEQRRAYALVHNKLTMNSPFDDGILTEELGNILDIDMSMFDLDVTSVGSFIDDLKNSDFFDSEKAINPQFQVTLYCVVQISAVCSKYDKLEKGAPSFDERMEMIRKIAPRVKRVVVRAQPFMHEVLEDVYKNLEVFKNAGAYGVIIEGLKHRRKKAGMVKVGGDYCYPYDIMLADFLKLREKAHKIGLKIYAGENRIRTYGDSMACCGIDGLEGFRGNEYNLTHILNGKKTQPTERQKEKGTAMVFCSLIQRKANSEKYKHLSFAEAMVVYYEDKKNWLNDVFGITKK